MTDHESASTGISSQSPPAASEEDSAPPVAVESSSANGSVKEELTSPKPESDEASSLNANGKETKSDVPKDNRGKHNREKGKNKERGKDSHGETKAKKPEPYVNEDRVKTGGAPREKLSPEELEARMERIRLNNEKIKERRAAVQADERAFQESQAALRAKAAEQKKIQAGIDEKRAAVARRKMEKAGVREWDSFKKGGSANTGGGLMASIHAPKSPDGSSSTDLGTHEGTNEANDGWGVPEEASHAGGESERGHGRGRGAGRARGRARGGRGGRGGGGAEVKRDKAPHIKDTPPQDNSQGDNSGDWGAAADEWGKSTDVGEVQTGIAITTNEDDPWGTATADDPWGTAGADDPWGNPQKS